MYRKWDSKFGSTVVTIFVGEYYVTKEPELIATVLGSCISVCLCDPINRVAGLNHFMLPRDKSTNNTKITSNYHLKTEDLAKKNLRYGVHSMEMLISELQKSGAERKNFKAKVFGGGKILRRGREAESIGEQNIGFVRAFLEYEGIPLIKEDVGNNYGRKIYLLTENQRVFVKRIDIRSELKVEKEYLEKLDHMDSEKKNVIF